MAALMSSDPLVAVHPDDTQTAHYYGVLGDLMYDDVVDGNQHLTGYLYDSFGRLKEVLGDGGL